MPLATGKGGKYRHYKCANRILRHNEICLSPSLPMEKLDQAVLQGVVSKVLEPARLRKLLAKLRLQLASQRQTGQAQITAFKAELADNQAGTQRLYEGVEKGFLPLDETLERRSQKLRARR